jgi:REP-associated tyrosine transposase
MARRARLDAPGTLHRVIVRGIERREIVDDVADRKNFVQRLGELGTATKTAVYGWALMTSDSQILLRSSEMGIAGTVADRTPLLLTSMNWIRLFRRN